MTELIYAIELDKMDTSGLTMSKIKIGKTTDLKSRLADYQTGMIGEPEVHHLWLPNPDVGLGSVERGVHDIAEQYAYDRSGEVFVFFQDAYQQFANAVNKLLETTKQAELGDEPSRETAPTVDDYTGEVPAILQLRGESYDVSSWTECLVTVAEVVVSQVDDQELVKQVSGKTREYVVEEGAQSQFISPKPIADSGLYIETNFSANDTVDVSKQLLKLCGYDPAELKIFTE
jgi:hypothetical protein